MPNLIVRNVPEDVVKALRERAGRHGTSAEAEHRKILIGNMAWINLKGIRRTYSRFYPR